MNIFYLHWRPDIAASFLCDKHLASKMIVESAQMLANCYTLDQLKNAPLSQKGNTRKHSYYNHPCSKWARTRTGYAWLMFHADSMLAERRRRWPQRDEHFTKSFLDWCVHNGPQNLDQGITSSVPQCFGDAQFCKNPDPVKAYRDYYIKVKSKTIKMEWTNLANGLLAPEWYTEGINDQFSGRA